MAFRCEICGQAQSPRTNIKKVVVATRQVRYPAIVDEYGKFIRFPEGHETVKELNACPDCAQKQYKIYNIGEKVIAE